MSAETRFIRLSAFYDRHFFADSHDARVSDHRVTGSFAVLNALGRASTPSDRKGLPRIVYERERIDLRLLLALDQIQDRHG